MKDAKQSIGLLLNPAIKELIKGDITL